MAAPVTPNAQPTNADLVAQTARETERLGQIILERGESRSPMVERVIRHTLEGGGKRLRPAFVLLAARAAGPDPAGEESAERLRRLGACMEMVHMATLVHDDVVDHADTRRGRPTAGVRFGNTASILSGDVLLARAMAILAEDGDLGIIRAVADAMSKMAEGEVRELELRGEFDLAAAAHLEVLSMKTAAFIRCCCEVGARAAGAAEPTRDALAQYGEEVGLAFQIADDLLDYRGDPAATGKAVGTDFREGQATLPLIRLRPTLTDAEEAIARARFGGQPSDDEMRLIREWMATRGAFDRAEAEAAALVHSAKERLRELPPSDARDALAAIADHVLARRA